MKALGKMRALLSRFGRGEDGLEMVEWAVVAGLLTIGGGLMFLLIGNEVGVALVQLRLVTTAL